MNEQRGHVRGFARAALVLLVAAISLLSGCRNASGQTSNVVRIGYFANATHAQAVLGVASGDFARAVAPAKLETRVFNAGPSLIEALFAGEIDIGYVGPGPVISAHRKSRGEGIRVIAGAAGNGVVIVARKGSGIASVADLAGRRVATPQLGNTQDISARHFLSKMNADLRNVIPIENAQQAQLLTRGEVDAAWVPEPWGERLVVETGATLVAEEKDLWPNREFALTVVVTTPEFLAKRPDVVRSVLGVHRAWTKKLVDAPADHVPALGDALFALTGKRLPEGVLPAAMKRVKLSDAIHDETLRTFAAWTHDLGFEKRAIDTNGLVDTTILRALEAE